MPRSSRSPPAAESSDISLSQTTGAGPSRRNVLETRNKGQPPSCDACRQRKLKCNRPAVVELGEDGTAATACEVSLPDIGSFKLI